ncbi:MAG: class I SAM-dependent RNA methyltransferase, partial [Lawsonibacter sp.]|nr:class I SAM-dependent RNA methyltransferase [Lawsonibacter sp.]
MPSGPGRWAWSRWTRSPSTRPWRCRGGPRERKEASSVEKIGFSVPTLFGLEGPCADEMRRLGLNAVRAADGRVTCIDALAQIPRLNLNLRTGERVLLTLKAFPVESFNDLFEGTRALPWEQFIPRDGQFPVKGHCLDSTLKSVPACQRLVKKAIASRLGEKYGLNTLPETGAVYQVQFAIRGQTAALMLDTTGPGLHKRGYRAQGVAAPLRETLAAGLVLLSRYKGRDPLCDPFCGSGTIPIEAALIARNRAPGLNRTFSAQRWAWLDKQLWLDAAEEAMDQEFQGEYDIWGGDLDPEAVALARHNAALAEVDDIVRFETADACRFHWGGLHGQVVTNPPYGERVMERREAEELYRRFGAAWRKLPDSWKLFLLSSHTEFERTFGRPADKKRKLYNGMLKCDLFM